MKFSTKIILIPFIIIIIIVIGFLVGWFNFSIITSTRESEQKLVLQKMQEIGKLELVKYNFNDVVEEALKREFLSIDNLAPDSKVLLIISGEATACIDLNSLTIENVKYGGDEIRLLLPQPTICYAKVNHDQSKLYDINLTARLLNPELVEAGFKNAEKKIKEEAISMGILEQAKINGEKLLTALLNSITDRKVIIEYE